MIMMKINNDNNENKQEVVLKILQNEQKLLRAMVFSLSRYVLTPYLPLHFGSLGNKEYQRVSVLRKVVPNLTP